MAELPGAPPQPWIVRNDAIPAGKVDKHKIASDLLKNERNLSVYTPPDYRANGKPYALLVLFDEGAYLNNVPTPVILDNLIAAGKIPPMVAVLIANPSQDTRSKELPPNPQFADFLATELLPWVHAHYTVTSDPKLTTVAGSSYGGIAATYAGLRHSERVRQRPLPVRIVLVGARSRRLPGHRRDDGDRMAGEGVHQEPEAAAQILDGRGCLRGRLTRQRRRHPRTEPPHARRAARERLRGALPAVQQRPRLSQLARHAGRRPDRAGGDRHDALVKPINRANRVREN